MTRPPPGWALDIPTAETAGAMVAAAWQAASQAAEAAMGLARAGADAEYASALRALEAEQEQARARVRAEVYGSWSPQVAKAQAVVDRAARLHEQARQAMAGWMTGNGPGDLGPWYDAVGELHAIADGQF